MSVPRATRDHHPTRPAAGGQGGRLARVRRIVEARDGRLPANRRGEERRASPSGRAALTRGLTAGARRTQGRRTADRVPTRAVRPSVD